MMPNIVRGGDVGKLVSYLVGAGRANEHTDPHLVGGSAEIMLLVGEGVLNESNTPELVKLLDAHRAGHGVVMESKRWSIDGEGNKLCVGKAASHVWHCSLSLRPGEGPLSDEQWSVVVEDFMTRMGFIGEEVSPVRWAAVRHGLTKAGGDHIHIAAVLVRQDGSKEWAGRDHYRAQQACNRIERKYGLEVVVSREERGGAIGVKPGELARAAREGWSEPERKSLAGVVRAAALEALDERGFVIGLRQRGVWVRPRFAKGSRTEVIGYAVARRPESGQRPVWYAGGKLASDLGLPALREGWEGDNTQTRDRALASWVGQDRASFEPGHVSWGAAEKKLGELQAQLEAAGGDRAEWARAARHIAAVMNAWAEGSGPDPQVARRLARQAELVSQCYRDRNKAARMQSVRRPNSLSWASAAWRLSRATKTGRGHLAVMRATWQLGNTLDRQITQAGHLQQAVALQQAMRGLQGTYARLETSMRITPTTTLARPTIGQARPARGGIER